MKQKKKLLGIMAVMMIVLTGCQKQEVREVSSVTGKEILRIGMECDYAPYSTLTNRQTDTSVSIGDAGFCDGYDVMIARKVADALHMEIQITSLSWDALLPAIKENEIDAIIGGISATDERKKELDFTTPYYESEMVVIVRKEDEASKFTDIQQFKGKTIVGQANTTYDSGIEQMNGVIHANAKTNYSQMVTALLAKEADAILAELPVAQSVIKANSDLMYIQFEEGKGFDIDTSISIAMKKGSQKDELFQKVQSALDGISEKERQDMMANALSLY